MAMTYRIPGTMPSPPLLLLLLLLLPASAAAVPFELVRHSTRT